MRQASSGQKAVLAWAAPLRDPTILMSSSEWDFQLHWLIPPGDPVGVMSNRVIRMDQSSGDSLSGAAHSVTDAIMAQNDKSSIYSYGTHTEVF